MNTKGDRITHATTVAGARADLGSRTQIPIPSLVAAAKSVVSAIKTHASTVEAYVAAVEAHDACVVAHDAAPTDEGALAAACLRTLVARNAAANVVVHAFRRVFFCVARNAATTFASFDPMDNNSDSLAVRAAVKSILNAATVAATETP